MSDNHEKLAKAYHELGRIQAMGFQEQLEKGASGAAGESPVASQLRERFGVEKEADGKGMGFLNTLKSRGKDALEYMGQKAQSGAQTATRSANNGQKGIHNKMQDAAEAAQSGGSKIKDQSREGIGQAFGRNSGTQATKKQLRNRYLAVGAGGAASGAGGMEAANRTVGNGGKGDSEKNASSNLMIESFNKVGSGEQGADGGEVAANVIGGPLVGGAINTARDPRSEGFSENVGDVGTRILHTGGKGVAGSLAGGGVGAGAGAGIGALVGGRNAAPVGAAIGGNLGSMVGSGYGFYSGTHSGEKAVDSKHSESSGEEEKNASANPMIHSLNKQAMPGVGALKNLGKTVADKAKSIPGAGAAKETAESAFGRAGGTQATKGQIQNRMIGAGGAGAAAGAGGAAAASGDSDDEDSDDEKEAANNPLLNRL